MNQNATALAPDDQRDCVTASDEELMAVAPESRARPLPPWQKTLVSELEQHGHLERACIAARCSRRTAERHRAANEDFRAAWEAAMESHVDDVELSVMEAAKAGSERLGEFVLKTRRRAIYGDRQELHISGQVNHAHLHVSAADAAKIVQDRMPLLRDQLARLRSASETQE